MNSSEAISEGLLSRESIGAVSSKLFPTIDGRECYDPRCLRGAAYDARVGTEAIAPDGTSMKLGQTGPNAGTLVLEPGESAIIRTFETLRLPSNIAANLTLKTSQAMSGLLLLSGMLVDPGYEGPLHICVVNVGSRRAVLRACDRLVALQFFRLPGERPREHPDSAAVSQLFETDPKTRPRPLAFLGSLRDLRVRHDALESEVRRTAELTTNVIALGFFLVGATVLGIVLDVALSFGSNKALVASVRRALPHSTSGQVLVIVGMLSAAWTIYSVSILFRGRRQAPPITDEDYYEAQARRRLESRRRLWLFGAMVLLIPIGIGAVALSRDLSPSKWPYLIFVCGPLILIAWGALSIRFAMAPVTARQIYDAAHRDRDLASGVKKPPAETDGQGQPSLHTGPPA